MGSFGTEFRYRSAENGQLQGGLVPVDFATIAAGYGCKTWRVTTLNELRSGAGCRASRDDQHAD